MQLCRLIEQHQKAFYCLLSPPPWDKKKNASTRRAKKKKYQHHRFPCRVCTSHFLCQPSSETERQHSVTKRLGKTGPRERGRGVKEKSTAGGEGKKEKGGGAQFLFFLQHNQARKLAHKVSKNDKSNRLPLKALCVGPWGLFPNTTSLALGHSAQLFVGSPRRSYPQCSAGQHFPQDLRGNPRHFSLRARIQSHWNKIKEWHFGQDTAKHLQIKPHPTSLEQERREENEAAALPRTLSRQIPTFTVHSHRISRRGGIKTRDNCTVLAQHSWARAE